MVKKLLWLLLFLFSACSKEKECNKQQTNCVAFLDHVHWVEDRYQWYLDNPPSDQAPQDEKELYQDSVSWYAGAVVNWNNSYSEACECD